jgi:hypothetical protein
LAILNHPKVQVPTVMKHISSQHLTVANAALNHPTIKDNNDPNISEHIIMKALASPHESIGLYGLNHPRISKYAIEYARGQARNQQVRWAAGRKLMGI